MSEIYFLEAVGLDMVKIGAARVARDRVAELARMMPCAVRLLRVIRITSRATDSLEVRARRSDGGTRARTGKPHFRVESSLHDRFAAHRVRGEWFRLSAIREAIKGLDAEDVVGAARYECTSCGSVLLAMNVSGKCSACIAAARTRARCIDCGAPRSPKSRGGTGRCAECSHAHFKRLRVELAAKSPIPTCADCGTELARTKDGAEQSERRCRGCGMRHAWKDPKYKEKREASRLATLQSRKGTKAHG